MDKATLNLLMNFHTLDKHNVDFPLLISKILREENVQSSDAHSGNSTNEFENTQHVHGNRQPSSLAYNEGNVLRYRKDVRKWSTSQSSSSSTSSKLSLQNEKETSVIKTDSSVAKKNETTHKNHCTKNSLPYVQDNQENITERWTKVDSRQNVNSDLMEKESLSPQETHDQYQAVAQGNDPFFPPPTTDCDRLENSVDSETPASATPVIEIGQIGDEECEAIISIMMSANNYFVEIPKHIQTEKLREEQTMYLSYKKYKEAHNVEDDGKETRAAILQMVLTYLEMKIVEIVKYAKKIPGFTDLSLEDQAALVKESRTESACIGGMKLINLDCKVFSSRCGKHFTMDEMNSVFSKEFLDQKVSVSKKIAVLNLCPEEETLLRAISITFSDRSPLENAVAVQNIQNKLLTCLIYTIKRIGKYNVGSRLGQLFDILMNMRDITEVDMKQVKKLLLESPAFTRTPVVEEFLT